MRPKALGTLLVLFALALQAANTSVQFNLARPEAGPFPSDALTVPDSNQKTGLRVNMPFPNCFSLTGLVACAEVIALNQLDGFNTKGRIRVSFSGPIDPATLRDGIRIVWLDSAVPVEFPLGEKGKVTPLNELVYDPQTNTAYGRPDQILDQSRRYAVVVTDAVRDTAGDPVVASPAFDGCINRSADPAGCAAVVDALPVAQQAVNGHVVAASVFTTISASAFIQEARARLEATEPGFQRLPGRNVFDVTRITSVTWRRQIKTSGEKFSDWELPIPPGLLPASGIGRVAFGTYRSPNYLDAQGAFPAIGTAQELPEPRSVAEIPFHVWLPATPAPPEGYPVVIAGHGVSDSRFGMPTALALTFCKQGYAVVAINAVGHGFGPESSFVVRSDDGSVSEIPAPGRGVDPGTGTISESSGFFASGLSTLLLARDTTRQTALDLSQLVRTIRGGIDLDGTGAHLLNGGDISYFGQSLGSFYGTVFLAIEPGVKAAVLNVGGESLVRTALISQTFRPVAMEYLTRRGIVNKVDGFDANSPFRDEPVRVNNVSGAIDIQNAEDTLHWIEAPGRPGNYAPRLVAATLPGVGTKRVLFQYAIGDRTVPNPANSALVHDAFIPEQVSVLRYDLLRGQLPGIGENPHAFITAILDDQLSAAVAVTAQAQALIFLATDSVAVPDVNDTMRLLFGFDPFQTPSPLPETLNWE